MAIQRRSLLSGIIFLLWINCAATFGQQVDNQKLPLALTLEIIDRQYCAINAELASLHLSLKLRYTNIGTQNLILYRGHDLFYLTKIRAVGTGETRPPEVIILNARYFDEEPEQIDRPSPSRVFATLRPGATDVREVLVGLEVSARQVRLNNQIIRDGEHTLQLIVSTWYKSKNLAQKLRQQWERKGLLWSEPLISNPLKFTVATPGSLAPCK